MTIQFKGFDEEQYHKIMSSLRDLDVDDFISNSPAFTTQDDEPAEVC